jgi:hypothetical protein
VITFKALSEKDEWTFIKIRANVKAMEDSQGIVAIDGERILAVCVADCFTNNKCNVHFAIDNPMVIRRGFFHEVARHLFITCGCNRIFGLVPESNAKAIKFDKHMGFTEVGRIPQGFGDDDDCVVLRMEKKTSRWLNQIQEAA